MKMQRRRRRGRPAAPMWMRRGRAAKKQGAPPTGSGSGHAFHSSCMVGRGVGPAWPPPVCPGKPPHSTSSAVSSTSCLGIPALSNMSNPRLVSSTTCGRAPGALPPPLSSSSSSAFACRRACTCTASQRAPDSPSSSA